ncbi:MAG: GtrA family protein [Nitrosopumilus sp.]|nr:GtrA family protein [Nitrosopumilus sp.]
MIVKLTRFALVGFTGMVLDFGITFLLKEKGKIQKYIANTIGFLSAATSNYYLNRIWTFRSSDAEIFYEYSRFIGVSVAGLAINLFILWFLHDVKKINFYVSKLLAIIITIAWNFSFNYIYTFGGQQ